MDLVSLGWTPFFESAWKDLDPGKEGVPARVISVHRDMSRVLTEQGEFDAKVSGKFRHLAGDKSTYPTAGDWVLVSLAESKDQGVIHALFPRFSRFSRKVPGVTAEEQILAANIDTVFLVTSLDADLSPRRVERYLSRVYDSGARPVILLTKSDLCEDILTKRAEIEAVAPDVPVLVLNGLTGEGVEDILGYLPFGKTGVLVGSSGVGKSTLLNRLLGSEVQDTGEVREGDSKGRHTTTHREMFLLPGGAWVIDNPGLREFQLWETDEGIEEAFPDILALAVGCKFRNCLHETEPRCAVKKAVEDGVIPSARWESYEKLKKELAFLERRVTQKAKWESQKQLKATRKFLKKKSEKGEA